MVFANAGALVLCPSLRVINIDELLAARSDAVRYAPLNPQDAKRLVVGLTAEDAFSSIKSHQISDTQEYATCA